VITIHQRYRQTDRQTDRQTTCDRNTALCAKVHRAVKKNRNMKKKKLKQIKACAALVRSKSKILEGSRLNK